MSYSDWKAKIELGADNWESAYLIKRLMVEKTRS
jgi:hypothetical protein